MSPPRRIPTKKELLRLQKLYRTDERIAERLNVDTHLVSYWRRKRNVAAFSAPKFTDQEINSLWERFGDDDRCGAELGISRAAFYNWRRKYNIREKPAFLKLEQMEFQFPGKDFTATRTKNYGKRTAAQKHLWERRDGKRSKAGERISFSPDLLVIDHDRRAVIEAISNNSDGAPLSFADRVAINIAPLPTAGPAQSPTHETLSLADWARRNRIRIPVGIKDSSVWERLKRVGNITPGKVIACERGAERFGGAIGALSLGFSARELAEMMCNGETEILTPESAQVILTGKRFTPLTATDIAIQLLMMLQGEKLAHVALEFGGDALAKFDPQEREALCAVTTLAEVRTALAPADTVTKKYLASHGVLDYAPLIPDNDAEYERMYQMNIEPVAPMAVWLHSGTRASRDSSQSSLSFVQAPKPNGKSSSAQSYTGKRLSFHALEELSQIEPEVIFIGGSPGGYFDDLKRAADVLRSKRIAENVTLLISPRSREDYLQALKKGVLRILVEAGAVILRPGVDSDVPEGLGAPPDATFVTTSFEQRLSYSAYPSDRFIVSPTSAAVAALKGRLIDPRGV